MTGLRLLLFLGLVLHKVVWEVMKRRDAPAAGRPLSPARRLVKGLKFLALAGLALQTLFLDVLPISPEPARLQWIGTAVYLAGLVTAVAGRLQLGSNWANFEDSRVLPGQALIEAGPFRYIRHPIYAGDLLLLAGLELALNSWLVLGVAALAVVVVRQALAEEALLARAFPGYRAYCGRTKRFIPFLV